MWCVLLLNWRSHMLKLIIIIVDWFIVRTIHYEHILILLKFMRRRRLYYWPGVNLLFFMNWHPKLRHVSDYYLFDGAGPWQRWLLWYLLWYLLRYLLWYLLRYLLRYLLWYLLRYLLKITFCEHSTATALPPTYVEVRILLNYSYYLYWRSDVSRVIRRLATLSLSLSSIPFLAYFRPSDTY